jgi:hypothetical protein
MIEGRQHPRFTLEALQPVGIVRERPRQNLDGDIASKLGVTGAVELRPCASAEHGENLVRTDSCTDSQRHML